MAGPSARSTRSSSIEVPGTRKNRVGPGDRLFADLQPSADEQKFWLENTSKDYYESPYYKAHVEDLQPVPAPRSTPPRVDLADVIGTDRIALRERGRRLVFHATGDTGASSASRIHLEARVADAMTAQLTAAQGADAPAFFFHLGDVVYNFGEAEYYYDQFYEPFRGYDAPIFAIPGNHDGFPQEGQASLFAFLRNFCTVLPERSPDSGGLVRSTMNQPGVYFTLTAPFVSIIGLYSNVLEGPGVISSEEGAYPLGDQQLEFLTGELAALKPKGKARERAVVLAVHHPPLAADAKHGGALGLSNDIDKACNRAGVWPDLVLSGHAHLYQRFTRHLGKIQIPYIVAGSGGHNVNSPPPGDDLTPPDGYTMPVGPRLDYGFLTITVDFSGRPRVLVDFNSTNPKRPKGDEIIIDLQRRVVEEPLAGT